VNRFIGYSLCAAGMIIASIFTATYAYPQGAENEGKKIISMTAEGNRVISTETILSKIRTKPGDKFNQETLNEDLKRLYATEYFTDVSIDAESEAEGVKVKFIVEEKSIIEDIVFKGNNALRAPKLKAVMKSKVNEMLNLALLAQDIAEIKDLYIKKGYPLIEVRYEIDVDKESNKAIITITVDEKVRVKVSKITITGNQAIKANKITKVLGTKPAWLFNQGVFKDEVFQEDLEKIKYLYDDIGYLDAEVTPKLDYSEDGTRLFITIDIKEGKQYLVGDIVIRGNLVFPDKDIWSKVAMKSGMPFSNRALRADVASIRQYYYRYGYMNVAIELDRTLNPATGKIDIVYNIDGKNPVRVGKIEIRGNIKTRDTVIRRELRIYPGERFDGEKIRRSKERLYNLGFFEDVSFDSEPTDDPDIQNLIVSVKETKTGEFAFGGGYSSIDQLIGFVSVTQRNFDIMNFPTFMGGGQSVTLKAEIGMVRNNYNVSWTDPWIFGFPYSLGFDFYRTSHKKATDVGWPYDETRTGGDLRLGKEFTDHLRGDLIYRLEDIRIANVIDNASQDLRDEEGSRYVSSLTLGVTYDTRDNVFVPTRGFEVGTAITDAGGFLMGDKDFIKWTGSAAYYHTFFEKLTLELKGRAGMEWAYSDTKKVPIYERFFAGGANTIRGYKERRVGPRDQGSDEPIGGDAILIGNAELTFPVFEKILKAAIFYDVGNVWEKAEEFLVGSKYKQGAGVGIRVKTPLGPVKLDYGYPLVKNEGDKKQGEFYFSMSHGF